MANGANLQDAFLNQARREKQMLTVFLTNGYQLRGRLMSFDSFTVVLDCEGKQYFIYKHAISTIIPSKNVPLFGETT